MAFCSANGGLKTNPRTLTVTILGLYRASLGMPDKSARIVTVKELQPANAASNTNETKKWPHLEAVADIEKSIIPP